MPFKMKMKFSSAAFKPEAVKAWLVDGPIMELC
jgi:hypothetical protein